MSSRPPRHLSYLPDALQRGAGATVVDGGTHFAVWAPTIDLVELVVEQPAEGAAGSHCLSYDGDGVHSIWLPDIDDGTLYRYRLDGRGPYPDPSARFQPSGVHGPSQVVDWTRYEWQDSSWAGLKLEELVFYELHVGTFTPGGTFAAARERLPELASLGVTAIELMPVADFPGRWNWGYDGVAPFAPARCYGTPDDLRRLVDRAHELGMAVFLDVVYNHFGPDGAYQSVFCPFYYSSAHQSPWGAALNFDAHSSDFVRAYIVRNALHWIHEYHVDGLRLDATHAIVDDSQTHILAALSQAVRTSPATAHRHVHLIAEDHRNLARMLAPVRAGGLGLDGLWSDDFHHQMRRGLAGDSDGYFQDFDGTTDEIAATVRQGWFYTGQYAPYFDAPRGSNPEGIAKSRLVFFLQNHDQIGNRAFGERLHHQIDPAVWRAASTFFLLLPETPLLFMGQEWAASTPFLYFTDHNADLGRAVTEGRRREFSRFAAFSSAETRLQIPDPQDPGTFQTSVLDWTERDRGPHAASLRLYRRLLELRRTELIHSPDAPQGNRVVALGRDALWLWRQSRSGGAILTAVQLRGAGSVDLRPLAAHDDLPVDGPWDLILTTEEPEFAADGRVPRITLDPLMVEFTRPGACVFRSARPVGEEAR